MTDAAKDCKCSPCQEYRFFLYDPNDGITFWKTEEERDKAAEDAIDSYRDEEWNEEVSGVFAGMATHNTVEINRVDRVGELDDDGYDEAGEYWANGDWDVKCNYKLQPIPQPHADHIPGVTKMVPAADGEREELARLLDGDAKHLVEVALARECHKTWELARRVDRAAVLLQQLQQPKPE